MKTLSSDQRVEHLQKIQSAYNKCKEYSDDKVQLAMQTYEMVSGRPGPLGGEPGSGQPQAAGRAGERAPQAAGELVSGAPQAHVAGRAGERGRLRPAPHPTRRGRLPRAAGQAEARLGRSGAARKGAPWRGPPPGSLSAASRSVPFGLFPYVCIYICCSFLSAFREALELVLATSLSGLPHLRLTKWLTWGSV